MTFTIPRLTDARALPLVSALFVAIVGCGNSPPPKADSPGDQPPPAIAARPDEKRFTSPDGWSFVAPKELEPNTAPGTTGFAVYRPPPAKPILNIVLTTEPFDGTVSAFVDQERAKVRIVKEETTPSGVRVEETWSLGEGEQGFAMVLFSVREGVGARLACLGNRATFETQRPICERAIQSLQWLRRPVPPPNK
jgi:hypothetical protein